MIRRFTSSAVEPRERGIELGSIHPDQVCANVAAYEELFAATSASFGHGRATEVAATVDAVGLATLQRLGAWAPALAEEISGIAAGAGLTLAAVAALNARTEVLATLGATLRGECSTVVSLGTPDAEPVALQNWDWFGALASGWFVWEIPHDDGATTTTLTEYGIVGKIGINDRGVGCLVNILNHQEDGAGDPARVPVHAAARRVLDAASSVSEAIELLASVRTLASTAITLVSGSAAGKSAVIAELWPGGIELLYPHSDGLLLHTNHFVAERPRHGDVGPARSADTLTRLAALRRQLEQNAPLLSDDDVYRALCDHGEGLLSLCCHPDSATPADQQYATLATVRLDFAHGALDVHPGNPCAAREAFRLGGTPISRGDDT